MQWPISTGGPLGVQPDTAKARVMNRTGSTLTVGQVVAFALDQGDAAVSNYRVGDEASIFANVVTPATADLKHGWFAIVTDGGADDTEVEVALWGIVDADVEGTNAAALTDVLVAADGQLELNSDAATGGQKILGIPLTTTAGATAETIPVLFNGITGFGNAQDQA